MPHEELQIHRKESGELLPKDESILPDAEFFEPLDVTAVNVRNFLIQWFLQPTNEDLGTITYEVYRGFNPTGPFIQIAEVQAKQFYFIDNNIPAVSKWDEVHYTVAAVFPNGTRKLAYASHLRDHPPGRVLAANQQARVVYRSHNGTSVLVYKKRRDGARCQECFDGVQGISTNDSCPVCMGTGNVQGYYPPIRTRCLMQPSQEQIDFQTHKHASATTQATMLRCPRVRPNDVIYEESHNRWWYVGVMMPTEDNRVLVAQEVSLKQVDPHDKVVDLLEADLAGNLLLPVV